MQLLDERHAMHMAGKASVSRRSGRKSRVGVALPVPTRRARAAIEVEGLFRFVPAHQLDEARAVPGRRAHENDRGGVGDGAADDHAEFASRAGNDVRRNPSALADEKREFGECHLDLVGVLVLGAGALTETVDGLEGVLDGVGKNALAQHQYAPRIVELRGGLIGRHRRFVGVDSFDEAVELRGRVLGLAVGVDRTNQRCGGDAKDQTPFHLPTPEDAHLKRTPSLAGVLRGVCELLHTTLATVRGPHYSRFRPAALTTAAHLTRLQEHLEAFLRRDAAHPSKHAAKIDVVVAYKVDRPNSATSRPMMLRSARLTKLAWRTCVS